MPKAEKQKLKLLYLLKLLQERSDENHPVSMGDILFMLEKEGIKAERKSIYSDILYLQEFGYDIEMRKGRNGGYYLASREFEPAELKVLVDAVQASRFITTKKSKELIGKITKMAGEHEAKHLNREVYVVNRVKSENESIYYNVDDIHRAMEKNVQISFKYLEYTVQKEVHYKHGGKVYTVSPWALTWSEEKYYLIAYEEATDTIKHFRVDKMKEIHVLDTVRVTGDTYKNLNLAEYCNQNFGMYSGESETITISFPNRLIGVIIDRFGKDITVHAKDEYNFTARLKVAVSPQLFGWITGLGPEVKIVNPPHVVEMYKKYISDVLKTYED